MPFVFFNNFLFLGVIKIVKRFYGGREISDEDLEKALLVGMSSYERRRFRKKRPELSLKHVKDDVLRDKEQKIGDMSLAPLEDSLVEQESHASDEAENGVADSVEIGTYIADVADTNVESVTETSDVASVLDNTKQVDMTRARHNSKLSLLGHGPHGRQVVDRILEEQGEVGIRDFCQRWRQVFVEAVHPRFLPGGWDVKHRYV